MTFPPRWTVFARQILTLSLTFLAASCGSKSTGAVDASPQEVASAADTISDGQRLEADGLDETSQPRGPSRLHSEGMKIVDAEGNTVVWRGVNLGGWMFHETWITLVGYPDHGRIRKVAATLGLLDEVDALLQSLGPDGKEGDAVLHVCPGNGSQWMARFEEKLPEAVGAESAEALLDALAPTPGTCDDSDLRIRALLEKRFGPDGRDELLQAFQESWIQESDIAWLAEQGFNVVRVPIGYRNLVTGPDSDRPTSLSWNEGAFERLDHLLDWCETYGVYAIIDIQEAPGGQNTYAADAGLYEDPLMQELTVELWEKLSDRFKERDVVGAYSLLAEPYGAPDTATRDVMYDLLVKAIRDRGDDHLCIIHDGFMGMESLPEPDSMGWDNVVYSTHVFEWTTKDLAGYSLLRQIYGMAWTEAQEQQNVPYYIGSFSTFYDEGWAYEAAALLVDWYESSGWSWSLWTYKRMDDPESTAAFGITTSWGLRRDPKGIFDRPDPYLDDFDTLKARFLAYSDLELAPNEDLLEALTLPGD